MIITDSQDFIVELMDRSYGGKPRRIVMKIDGRTGDIDLNGKVSVNGTDIATIVNNNSTFITSEHFIPAVGQTDFTLTNQAFTASITLLINGYLQRLNHDFIVIGNKITWISPDFSLAPTDDVEVRYESVV